MLEKLIAAPYAGYTPSNVTLILLLDYTNTDYWGTKLVRNDSNYLPIGTASYPVILESSLSLLYKNAVTDVRQTWVFIARVIKIHSEGM